MRFKRMVFAASNRNRIGQRSSRTSTGYNEHRSRGTTGSRGQARGHTATQSVRPGDNSNTQYALLGLKLRAKSVSPSSRKSGRSARSYWESASEQDGSWTYTPNGNVSTASIACAGISSLIISRHWSSP